MPKQIPTVFNNRSNYDYHYIIKQLANRFQGFDNFKTFNLLIKRKYWKIHNLFSPVERVVMRIDRNGEEVAITISYKQQLIDRAVFMASPLSNLADNLAKWIHQIKCKNCNTCCID